MKSFNNVNVYVEGKGIIKASLCFDEKIAKISLNEQFENGIEIPSDCTVFPGFIDEHIHGAGGFDAMDGTTDALSAISKTLVKEGTTSYLATTMTVSKDKIITALNTVKNYTDVEGGAKVLGVHLEGPFISKKFKGAQAETYVEKPSVSLMKEFILSSGNKIKIVSLAVEEDGGCELVKFLNQSGIVASIGHSSAKYEDVLRAVDFGAKSVTHTYNAQSPLHHREIGVVGSAMLIDELNTEIICDTIHVSVPAIKMLLKNKNDDKVIMITDSMRAKGLADGESELGGQKVIVKEGEARLVDGTLAGSILKMNDAIKNMVEKVGVKLETAIDFATKNPAKTLGVYDSLGSIKEGKCSDFTILDKDFNVYMTIVNGKIVYKK